MRKKTILIVDDEPLSIRILQHQLESEHKILLAQSGEEALKILTYTLPDMILLDILMPDMDGYALYRKIREKPELAETPILFVTSLESHAGEAEGLALGASDYIHKPFHADLVRLRVRNHLALHDQRKLLLMKNAQLEKLNLQLKQTTAQVKLLEGIIPICSYCHKIRDDQNIWKQLEMYICEHSDACFSHGICPDCLTIQRQSMKSKKKADADSQGELP